MKKIITLFVFVLGVSFTASAQKAAKPATATTATSPQAKIQQAALEDVKALNEVVSLDNAQMQDFRKVFENKHTNLAANLSDERKAVLAEGIEAKINATLTPAQLTKLNAKPDVLKKLTGKK